MAELVDAVVSKAIVSDDVLVRLQLRVVEQSLRLYEYMK